MNDFISSFSREQTRTAYLNDLTQFLQFCAQQFKKPIEHPNEIGETVCTMWFHHLRTQEKPLANKTLARKISALSSFFKYCQRKKITNMNPVVFAHRPKISNIGKTNILTKDEVFHILDQLQKRSHYAYLTRDERKYKFWKKRHAIFYLLFTVGLRVSELCQLKIEDLEKISESTYRLHLIAKGHEKHAPLIHQKTAFILTDYIKTFFPHQTNGFIFEKAHRTHIYQIVKQCVKIAGIQKKISPHSLRASLATHLHKKGVPLGHVKDLLNHKNINTTLLYTRVSDEELEENAKILD